MTVSRRRLALRRNRRPQYAFHRLPRNRVIERSRAERGMSLSTQGTFSISFIRSAKGRGARGDAIGRIRVTAVLNATARQNACPPERRGV